MNCELCRAPLEPGNGDNWDGLCPGCADRVSLYMDMFLQQRDEAIATLVHRDNPMCPAVQWVKPLHPIGPEDDPPARLLGQVRILGADFHVNAEAVKDTDDGQAAILEASETYVPEIQQLIDGAGETVAIGGRTYLLVISPFQQ